METNVLKANIWDYLYIIRNNILLMLVVVILSSCSENTTIEPEGMVYIPAGEFIMGSNDVDTAGLGKEFGARQGKLFEDERPVRKLNIEAYFIDKYEVTNKDYNFFCEKSGYSPPPTWENGFFIAGQDMHPVENVSWYDANKYCIWAGKRLPTEEEWEKAARGPEGNRYPWGKEFDIDKANLNKGDTVPVGSITHDKSYYGVYDMGGNVMEWTDSWFKPYPGSIKQTKDFGEKYRVLRGGSGSSVGHYAMSKSYSRTSYRHYYLPGGKGNDGGFRCVKRK